MPTKRTPIHRSPQLVITNAALDIFEQVMRLKRKQKWSRKIADLSYALDVELGKRPWYEDVLDCDTDEPPDYMRTDAEIEGYRRSRAIRLKLENLLRDRRRAAREAKRAQKAAEPPPDQPTPPPAS